MLNRVLLDVKNGNGFGVGPSINPCTKGLWIWAKPIVGYTEDGEQVSVLVVDSEGIGGLDEDNNHDMRIFSLALLLSSFFVYNSMGSIDENALQSLNFVTNISKLITVRTQEDESPDDPSLVDYMPKFMWTVRDFSLQLINDQNEEIQPKEYLERALRDVQATGNADYEAKNAIKQHLRKYFPDRDCCTLVRPVTNEEDLQRLDSIGMEDLRPEFVEQLLSLRKKVLHSMKVKEINGQPMDGKVWVALVEQFVQAINGGTVPSIESSWTYICREQAQEMLAQKKQELEEAIQRDLVIPTNDKDVESCLLYHLDKLKAELVTEFSKEPEIAEEVGSQFEQFAKERVAEVSAHNLNECRQVSTTTLTSLFQELNQRFMTDPSVANIGQQLRSLEVTLQEVWTLYDSNVPEYQEKYLIFLNGKSQFLNDLIYFIHANLETENQATSKILNELKDRNQSIVLEVKEQGRLEKQTLETKLKETVLSKSEIEAQYELLNEQFQALK